MDDDHVWELTNEIPIALALDSFVPPCLAACAFGSNVFITLPFGSIK